MWPHLFAAAEQSGSSSPLSGLSGKLLDYCARVPVALLVIAVSWIIIGRYRRVLKALLQRGRVKPILTNLLVSAAGVVGWIICISLVFSVMGFNAVAVAFSGSIGLIALGLASSATSIVADLYGGISLIADDNFTVGSRIKAAGVEGRIVDMNVRKTKIVDDEGNIYVIPNKTIDGGTFVIVNEKKRGE